MIPARGDSVARELFILEVDTWTVGETTKFRKVGTPTTVLDQVGKTGQSATDEIDPSVPPATKKRTDGFTLYCDEDIDFGGDSAAPWPLDYFLLAIGF
jgi:hypothetical protein